MQGDMHIGQFLDLLDDVKVGDFIIVHAGFAIEKLDKEEAEKTIALFKEITDFAIQNFPTADWAISKNETIEGEYE